MGHSVLAVPVPVLEEFVRARWAHYEPAWVSTDPAFTHAHVTVLSPWLSDPAPADLDAVARLAAETSAWDYDLTAVEAFPNGVIHVPPAPAAGFRALTGALATTFPSCPPYGGEFGDLEDLVPHVTLDHAAGGVTQVQIAAMLTDHLPLRGRAERLEWQWYDEGDCHVRGSWPLGDTGPARGTSDAPEA